MAWRKVSSTVVHTTYEDLRQYLAQTTGKSYVTWGLAIAGLGIFLVGEAMKKNVALQIGEGLVTKTGLGIALGSIVDTFLTTRDEDMLSVTLT